MHARSRIRRLARAASGGFTLLEMLVVLMIIGVLSTYLVVNVPTWVDRARMTACERNMARIWEHMTAYQTDHQSIPKDEGQRFFMRLWKDKYVDHTAAGARLFFCPSEPWKELYLDEEELFAALDDFDGLAAGSTSYAGFSTGGDRDLRRKARQGDGNLVVIADAGLTHKTGIIYLTADGVTHRMLRSEIEEELGYDPWEQDGIQMGPGSEIERFQTVSND
ncbi:MAG TPA: type II secretion system protein [Planctomycetota bacterium]